MKETNSILFLNLTETNLILASLISANKLNCVFSASKKDKLELVCVLLNDKEINFTPQIFKESEKIKTKLECIVVGNSEVEVKNINKFLPFLKENGEVIVLDNFKNYVTLLNIGVTVIFVKSKIYSEKIDNKIEIKNIKLFSNAENELCERLKTLSSEIAFKKIENYISKYLSRFMLIEAIIKPILILQANKPLKKLKFSRKVRNRFIELVKENISITNSSLITIADYNKFNYYKFLSGSKGIWSLKKHFDTYKILSKLEKLDFKISVSSSIQAVKTMIAMASLTDINAVQNKVVLEKLEKINEKDIENSAEAKK